MDGVKVTRESNNLSVFTGASGSGVVRKRGAGKKNSFHGLEKNWPVGALY
jgi:hypothetical protein